MLLCGIIDKLQQESENGMSHGWKPIYFFCQATDNQFNDATSVVRGLLESLFAEHKRLRDKMNRTDIPYYLDINRLVMLRKTLMEALQDPDLPGLYLIVDALDECRHGLQDLLRLIADASNLSSVRIKVLVSSRPSETIENEFNNLQQKIVLSLESDQPLISESVQLYILHKVKELADKKRYDKALRHVVQQHLESNAHGTFLWVALVCKALQGMDVLARHTLQILEAKFPAGLENFYTKMIEDLNKSWKDADVCKQILSIACVVYRPINWDEMVSLLGQPDLQGAKSIITSCGSFLTIQEDAEVISFVHQSAKDFLLENANARRQILPFEVDHQHYRIFSISLQDLSRTLERDMYKLKDPGFHRSLVSPPEPDPLAAVRYSCVYWADHLLELVPPGSQNLSAPEGKVEIKPLTDIYAQSPRWYIDLIQLIFKSLLTLAFLLYNPVLLSLRAREFHESMKNGGLVHEFLQDKYLYWLEALSLLSSIPKGVRAMERLEACSRNVKSRELYSLINDARRFILSQKGAIEIAPLQVYVSALVFSPSGSLIKQLFNREEPKWICGKPKVGTVWDHCLQTLEGHDGSVRAVVFSNDGQRLASGSYDTIVKIWDATSGDCLQTLEGHNNRVTSVVFSNDGRRLASGSYDTTVKIWDATSGDCLQTLEGHNSRVTSVVFSNDGRRLASGSDDKTVKIWDATSGNCLHTLFVGRPVYQLSFDPKTKFRMSTEFGAFNLPSSSGTAISDSERAAPRDRSHSGYGISADGIWIVNEGQNVLWIPPKYRPMVSAVADSAVALASQSGCMCIMRFSPDIKDPEKA
ncbi:unnamed protein product [Penicillium egyptiacum]|uniref:Nephrocystin 3-like N-terminal domain-containing protein n=1 Tax=Penicillium egyptiacum TaxID=1303716 RepID=A0A9W4P404_9EURO|nr:unnamed protein product [Penicillium egyptiacum]